MHYAIVAIRISSWLGCFSKSKEGEMILGELNEDGVPIEFIEPLPFEIMEDPVIFPPQGDEIELKNVDHWVVYRTFEKAKAQIDKLRKLSKAEIRRRKPTSIEIEFQKNLFDFIADYVESPLA